MRTINAFCLAALCLVSVAGAQEVATTPAEEPAAMQEAPGPDHDGLRALRATMEDALNKRDLDALLANVDDNVVFTAMNAEAGYGKQHIRDYFDRMLNGPNKIVENIKVSFIPDKLSEFYGPDVAVSAGKAASHYELTNGLKFDIDARWTATLVHKDGRWLVGAFHYSANVFKNPIMEQQRKYLLMAGGAAAIVLAVAGFIIGRRRRAPAAA